MTYLPPLPETQMDKAAIGPLLNVSRETEERLQIYVDLLCKWQRRINLISSNTIPEIWKRHVLDSAQLIRLLPQSPCQIMDIGTGAGLPGLILAIISPHHLHLVESDSRKIAFLRTALRETGTMATLYEDRIEKLKPMRPDIITARALAPVDRLLAYCQHQHHAHIEYLFLKGREAKQELTLLSSWPKLVAEQIQSWTDPQAKILRIKEKIK